MEKPLRLFFALEIPEETRRELEKFAVTLEKPWHPVKREQMHITLAFMGEVAESALEEIVQTGEVAASGVEPFSLALSDTASFPESGDPRVLYARVDGGGALAVLAESLRERLGNLADQKKMKAHLTLARCRTGRARKILRKFRADWQVDSFSLFKSTLLEEGPKYELIKRFLLKNPG